MTKKPKVIKQLIYEDERNQIVRTIKLKDNEVKCTQCTHIFVCDGTNKFKEVMTHMILEHPDETLPLL